MRKNGVNKRLLPIEGGVCAVEGFRANAVYCGIAPKDTPFYSEAREDLGLIVSDKLVPTACVYAAGSGCGAPVAVTKKHLKRGLARAIVVNGGVANVGAENGEREAERICASLKKRLQIDADEVAIASTGAITGRFCADRILQNVDRLIDGLGSEKERSLSVARAMITADKSAKQFAFSFELGDYVCKIGGVCKGGARSSPRMATTLCFLTTDVQITPQMLQKALTAAVDCALNALVIDGISSPNDAVFLMANGRAGNCVIDRADGEYRKFLHALTETLVAVCKMLAEDGGAFKAFSCEVAGARSKRFARLAARGLVGASGVKEALKKGVADRETLLCAALSALGEEESFELARVDVSLISEAGKLLLVDEGKAVACTRETQKRVIGGDGLKVCLHFHSGNYGATAFGRV